MTDLTTWLLAQIEADEAVARAAIDPNYGSDADGHWTIVSIPYEGSCPRDPDGYMVESDADDEAWAVHATRHDPARVLAQCAAYRAIVEMHDLDGEHCVMCHWEDARGCPTLRALASIYADRDGWREEWAL